MLTLILQTMRPHQWIKNGLLFAGLIFSGKVGVTADVYTSLKAFAVFCLGSSSIYILNDIVDRNNDKIHPIKKSRPIASGKLSVSVALTAMIIMASFSIMAAVKLFNIGFAYTFIGYFVLMLLYLFVLKHIVILDLLAVAIGFVLRAVAGAVVLSVEISPWLINCTFLLALLMLMGKRRHEILLLGSKAYTHRFILKEYSRRFLDQLIAVVTSAAVVSYALYTFSEDTIARLGTRLMPLTIPFVLYGIFRYLYLTHQRNLGGEPEKLLIRDKSSLINIFLWIVTAGLILYFT